MRELWPLALVFVKPTLMAWCWIVVRGSGADPGPFRLLEWSWWLPF